MSNALGTINPVAEIVAHRARSAACRCSSTARRRRITCRSTSQALDCDFYAFTGHKLYGPTGIGVLYGKEALLDAMPPFLGGGDMIRSVTFEKSHLERAAVQVRGRDAGHRRGDRARRGDRLRPVASASTRSPRTSRRCSRTATAALTAVAGVRLIGTARRKASVLSFVIDGVHPHDIGTIVDREGVAIRTGHHCAQPVMDRFGMPATARASFAMYNTRDEIDALVRALGRVKEVFA